MPEYERTASLAVGADEAFMYLSDAANLTSYVATMVKAVPEEGHELLVAADVQGRHEEGEASFEPDPAARTIEWGSKKNPRYRGWLQVSDTGGGSSVTVRISTDRDDSAEEIDRALDDTMTNIRSRLSGS
jgi:hypothetical protein